MKREILKCAIQHTTTYQNREEEKRKIHFIMLFNFNTGFQPLNEIIEFFLNMYVYYLNIISYFKLEFVDSVEIRLCLFFKRQTT